MQGQSEENGGVVVVVVVVVVFAPSLVETADGAIGLMQACM